VCQEAGNNIKNFNESRSGGKGICKTQEEIRRLCHQLACTVLSEAIQNDGTVVPEGTKGNQLRQAVGIMDSPISKVLQSGAALVELELWQLHTEHITNVNDNVERAKATRMPHTIPRSLIGQWHFLLTPLPAPTMRLPR
jgi:hypothetical protein